MKSRILLPALLALTFGLTACTQESSPAAVPAPVEETGESALTGENAAFPVGHLRRLQGYESTADAIYNPVNFWNDAGEPQLQLLKVDLTNAQRVSLYFGGSTDQDGVQLVPWQEGFCIFAGDTMYQVSGEGGQPRAFPLGSEENPEYADEYAAYDFDCRLDAGSNSGKRIDLETGQITELELPGQIEFIFETGGPRFMIARVITAAPLPSSGEGEAFQALLQSGEREYDWYDPATGALEKILTEPYYGVEQPDGSRRRRDYMGMAGNRLYFSWYMAGGTAGGVESCALDGSDWQPLPGRPGSERPSWTYNQNGTLCWMMGGESGDLWLYDLSDGQLYELPHITVANGWPEALVGQNQVLVSRGREPGIVDGFALISRQDYLAGSTDWTPIVDAPAEPSA